MALRGSLREFELSEIFQLISRDSKTGQLVLSNRDAQAFVIFSKGAVISAGSSEQNLQTFLFRYLKAVRHYAEEEMNELLYVCHGEMRQFSQELVNRKYLTVNELTALAQMAIEDLACGLFLWDDGNYRFDTLDGIQEYLVGGVSFPVDAITMEAMRRSDEWKRIRQNMSNATIFSVADKSKVPAAPASPLSNPSEYVLSMVDGTASVGILCDKSILHPYRVYETLFGLWQNSVIAPLAVKRQETKLQSLSAGKRAEGLASAVASVVIVLVWMSALFLVSYFGKQTFLRNADTARFKSIAAVEIQRNIRKNAIASLQYRALRGQPPQNGTTLVASGLISKNDAITGRRAAFQSDDAQ
jgi:hypothetical protein